MGQGLARAAVFLLVAVRLAGFLCVGPLLGRAILPWPVRIGLVVLLTLIVAPGLPIPDSDAVVIPVAHEQPAEFPAETMTPTLRSDWSSPASLLAAGFCEAAIGAALGLSVAIFLAGVRLGGEWIDRHSGLGMGSVLNPDFSAGGSAPAELTLLFCVTVLLVTQPINGHLLAVRFVLDTFHAIPIGTAQIPGGTIDLLKGIVQQSLILGLRIAMPFVVAMALLDMTLGWIRRSSRWEIAPMAYALRAGAALMILAATLPGIQEAVSASLYETFRMANDGLLSRDDRSVPASMTSSG